MKVTPVSRNYTESEFTDTPDLKSPITSSPLNSKQFSSAIPFDATHFAALPQLNLGDVGTPSNNLYDLN